VKWVIVAGLLVVGGELAAASATAQDTAPQLTPAPAVADVAAPAPPIDVGGAKQFMKDVGSDYKHFLSVGTAVWLGIGGAAALSVHAADDNISDEATSTSMSGGQQYGALYVQIPLAAGWWIAGHAIGSGREAAAGRDLLRAQISAVSWTYLGKYAVNRDRPNGDPRSFPSGHASATFATAMVLQDHYGWKLSVPAFAAATYTAVSRVADEKHWASDVVFGAFVGLASARTVTIRFRGARASIAPAAVPGGGAVRVEVKR
jgi:membrane-associated phospholipid phosphatase